MLGSLKESYICHIYRCFGDPMTRTRSWQPGQGVAKMAWSNVMCDVTALQASKSDINIKKKKPPLTF